MPGTKWITGDVITFQRMNQKTVIVQAAEPTIMYAGMLWFDIDDDKLHERNAANAAWIERPGVTLAATISGLWTFSRGAAVPFAVAAGSLNVTNLDADLLDGQHRVLKINADHAHSGAGAEGGTLDAAAIAAGILAVARGGTGLGAYAQGGILYISAANTLSRLAPAAANRVLRSTAANALEFGALVVADIPNLTTAKLTDVPAAAWATIFSATFPIATVLNDHDKAAHDALGITPGAHPLATTGPHTGTLPDGDVAGHAVPEVLAIISCSNTGPFTTTSAVAVVIDYTDFLLNISDFPANAKGILRIVWKNSGNNTNNMDLYDQFGAAPVANSSESEAMATEVWEISETDAPFTLPAGLKSFQLRLWTSGGTLTVSKAELQIERAT